MTQKRTLLDRVLLRIARILFHVLLAPGFIAGMLQEVGERLRGKRRVRLGKHW